MNINAYLNGIFNNNNTKECLSSNYGLKCDKLNILNFLTMK